MLFALSPKLLQPPFLLAGTDASSSPAEPRLAALRLSSFFGSTATVAVANVSAESDKMASDSGPYLPNLAHCFSGDVLLL